MSKEYWLTVKLSSTDYQGPAVHREAMVLVVVTIRDE